MNQATSAADPLGIEDTPIQLLDYHKDRIPNDSFEVWMKQDDYNSKPLSVNVVPPPLDSSSSSNSNSECSFGNLNPTSHQTITLLEPPLSKKRTTMTNSATNDDLSLSAIMQDEVVDGLSPRHSSPTSSCGQELIDNSIGDSSSGAKAALLGSFDDLEVPDEPVVTADVSPVAVSVEDVVENIENADAPAGQPTGAKSKVQSTGDDAVVLHEGPPLPKSLATGYNLEKIAAKDAAEQLDIDELRKEAQEFIDDFYASYRRKIEERRADRIEIEEPSSEAGKEWERVASMAFNPKIPKGNRDKSRMREILVTLKHKPPVMFAAKQQTII